jgi:hypothetical protein
VLFQFFDVRFSGAPVNGVLQHQSGLAALRREELGQEKLLQNGKPSAAAARHMEMLPRNGLFALFTTFR